MILLWGLAHEAPLAAVGAALRRAGVPFRLLDQEDVATTRVEHRRGRSRLTWDAVSLDLDDVSGGYLRPYGPDQIGVLANADPAGAAWRHAMRINAWMWAWADTTSARIINRPSAMESNHAKPWQHALIRAHGFALPDTLVTNDPDAARRFWRRHGEVIIKSVSSRRSIVRRLAREDRDRLADLAHCPVQLQSWIQGRDVRVHVLRDQVFALEISAEGDDYRYASNGFRVMPCVLPAAWARRCVALVRSTGLVFGGVDLRRTPDGRWFCFEINPSPAFTFFGEEHSEVVAAALAEELAKVQALPQWRSCS